MMIELVDERREQAEQALEKSLRLMLQKRDRLAEAQKTLDRTLLEVTRDIRDANQLIVAVQTDAVITALRAVNHARDLMNAAVQDYVQTQVQLLVSAAPTATT